MVRRRPDASADYSVVNPELARIPEASPVVAPTVTFSYVPVSLIRSSRVVPRSRLASSALTEPAPIQPQEQPELKQQPSQQQQQQYLFENAQVEKSEQPAVVSQPAEPRRKIKVKKAGDGSRRVVSSRVQKAPAVALTSAAPPVTFYTTFTYLTTFLHGTHTVYQSRESVVSSVHSGALDPTLLSKFSNGYLDGSTTVPVATRTKGLATTIVNLQRLSLIHI